MEAVDINMNFLTTLRWPLRIWQIFATAPFDVTNKTMMPVKDFKLTVLAGIWLIVHITLLILCIFYSSTFINWENTLQIRNYDTSLAMITVRFLSCLIVGEAIFNQHKQINFLQKILQIDTILQQKLQIQIDYKKHYIQNNILTTIWIFMCFSCAICVFVVYHETENTFDECFWIVYAIPFFVLSLQYHRMVLYLHAIRLRYQMLNQFIEKACLFQERGVVNNEILNAFKQISKFTYADGPVVQLISKSQLMDIRNIYQISYETAYMINDIFWWSIPLCIGIDFHRLLVHLYMIFGGLLFHLNWDDLLIGLFLGCMNLAHFVVLSHACQSTNQEVRIIPLQNEDFWFLQC